MVGADGACTDLSADLFEEVLDVIADEGVVVDGASAQKQRVYLIRLMSKALSEEPEPSATT